MTTGTQKLKASLTGAQKLTATLYNGPPGPPGPPGPGITQQNVVTGSRTANGVYRNTGSGAMYVLVTWTMSTKDATVVARTDANNPPMTAVQAIQDPSTSGSVTASLNFIVLPGNYYMCDVTFGTPALVGWIEYI